MNGQEEKKDCAELKFKRYVIKGIPPHWTPSQQKSGQLYISNKMQKGFWLIELENQHNNEPPLSGPLVLEVEFYMPLPRGKGSKALLQKSHSDFPSVAALLKFIEMAGERILFESSSTITSTIARKFYSEKPRTEFILKRI